MHLRLGFGHLPLLVSLCCLQLLAVNTAFADLGRSGAFEVDVGRAHFGLYVPESLTTTHGPSAVYVFFGGMGDSVSRYQERFGTIAEALDIIVVVPQMDWFSDPGRADADEVQRAFQRLLRDVQSEYQLNPGWLFIGGASRGGAPAHALARRLGSRTDLLILASTGPFAAIRQPRTLHVVAENEAERLGSGRSRQNSLGSGHRDAFIISGGRHSAQIDHQRVWLESEVARLRLEAAETTLREAANLAQSGDRDQAANLLRSTWRMLDLLRAPVDARDALFDYERQRRLDLLEQYAPVIERLDSARGHLEGE